MAILQIDVAFLCRYPSFTILRLVWVFVRFRLLYFEVQTRFRFFFPLLLYSTSTLCRSVPPRWNRGHIAKLYFLRTSWLLCIAKPRIAGNDHSFSTFSNFCYSSIFVSKDSWEQCFCHPRILEHDHTHSTSAWQPVFVHSVLSLPLSLLLSPQVGNIQGGSGKFLGHFIHHFMSQILSE